MIKNYLSFGAGINSVAALLLFTDLGIDFEAVYVNHQCDWPETYQYVEMLKNKNFHIKIISPNLSEKGKTWNNLYDYCYDKKIVPSRLFRWCTDKFKIKPLQNYFETPCFSNLGFDKGEEKRAKISSINGIENRFPLIEYEMDRQDCINYIKSKGLPIPMKSGCWFCPFQRIEEYRRLRRIHPDLYCKAKGLEKNCVDSRIERNKKPIYLNHVALDILVNEKQNRLWEEEQPPCYCEL